MPGALAGDAYIMFYASEELAPQTIDECEMVTQRFGTVQPRRLRR